MTASPGTAYPSADLDRRTYAFLIDRLVGWAVIGAAAAGAYVLFWRDGAVWPGVGLVAGAAVLVWLLFAIAEGATGRTPGKALTGVRTVAPATGGSPGVGRSLLRSLVLALAGVPTVGLGWATLGWTAASDPSGRRRGWHDRVGHTEVVDVRPIPVVVEPAPEAPRSVVNLTAMRLAPPVAAAADAPIPRPERSADSGVHRRREVPASEEKPAERPAPVPPAELPTWIVQFDTGQEITLQGVALVGRSPQPRPGEQVAHLLPLPSQDMSVSKTHAQLHIASDGALVVIDRGSTNGSLLLRKGVSRDLSAGRATTLIDGDKVRFGDREMAVRRG